MKLACSYPYVAWFAWHSLSADDEAKVEEATVQAPLSVLPAPRCIGSVSPKLSDSAQASSLGANGIISYPPYEMPSSMNPDASTTCCIPAIRIHDINIKLSHSNFKVTKTGKIVSINKPIYKASIQKQFEAEAAEARTKKLLQTVVELSFYSGANQYGVRHLRDAIAKDFKHKFPKYRKKRYSFCSRCYTFCLVHTDIELKRDAEDIVTVDMRFDRASQTFQISTVTRKEASAQVVCKKCKTNKRKRKIEGEEWQAANIVLSLRDYVPNPNPQSTVTYKVETA